MKLLRSRWVSPQHSRSPIKPDRQLHQQKQVIQGGIQRVILDVLQAVLTRETLHMPPMIFTCWIKKLRAEQDLTPVILTRFRA